MNSSKDSNIKISTPTIFLRDITRLDCAIFDPAKGVYGQSWRVDLEVSGELNENGFVSDFSEVKHLSTYALKTTLDHALLIPIKSKFVRYEDNGGREQWNLTADDGDDQFVWQYTCPKGSVFPVRAVTLTVKAIEQEFERLLRHRLPSSLDKISVTLHEEDVDPTEALFRYTHGITNHDGHCQRLFHGHSSLIEIYVDEKRRPDLEHHIVRDVFGEFLHVATPEQMIEGDIASGTRGTTNAPVKLSTSGSLGTYEATLPANRVFILERETSIECLSKEVALIIKRHVKECKTVKAVCYEGIGKGAISEIS